MSTENTDLPFASDGSFFEQFQRLQAERLQAEKAGAAAQLSGDSQLPPLPSGAGEGTAPPLPDGNHLESTSTNNEEFRPSDGFRGRQPGYLFKNGEQGIGYYKDIGLEGWVKAKQDAAKAKPVSLKANKSLVKLPMRPGGSQGQPIAKKAKTDASDAAKPKYLREMDKYSEMSCGDGKTNRPLVK